MLIETYVMGPHDDKPQNMTFASREEMLKWSREWPKKSVCPYDDPDHYYRAGEEHLFNLAS